MSISTPIDRWSSGTSCWQRQTSTGLQADLKIICFTRGLTALCTQKSTNCWNWSCVSIDCEFSFSLSISRRWKEKFNFGIVAWVAVKKTTFCWFLWTTRKKRCLFFKKKTKTKNLQQLQYFFFLLDKVSNHCCGETNKKPPQPKEKVLKKPRRLRAKHCASCQSWFNDASSWMQRFDQIQRLQRAKGKKKMNPGFTALLRSRVNNWTRALTGSDRMGFQVSGLTHGALLG